MESDPELKLLRGMAQKRTHMEIRGKEWVGRGGGDRGARHSKLQKGMTQGLQETSILTSGPGEKGPTFKKVARRLWPHAGGPIGASIQHTHILNKVSTPLRFYVWKKPGSIEPEIRPPAVLMILGSSSILWDLA